MYVDFSIILATGRISVPLSFTKSTISIPTWFILNYVHNEVLLLMEEILHQLICNLSHYLQGFIDPRWCRISSINRIIAWGCTVNHVMNISIYTL